MHALIIAEIINLFTSGLLTSNWSCLLKLDSVTMSLRPLLQASTVPCSTCMGTGNITHDNMHARMRKMLCIQLCMYCVCCVCVCCVCVCFTCTAEVHHLGLHFALYFVEDCCIWFNFYYLHHWLNHINIAVYYTANYYIYWACDAVNTQILCVNDPPLHWRMVSVVSVV